MERKYIPWEDEDKWNSVGKKVQHILDMMSSLVWLKFSLPQENRAKTEKVAWDPSWNLNAILFL